MLEIHLIKLHTVCYCFIPGGILLIKFFQGILSNVTLSNEDLLNWTIYRYPLNNISIIEDLPEPQDRINIIPPVFYTGRFTIPKNDNGPLDTFINMDGWGKVIGESV